MVLLKPTLPSQAANCSREMGQGRCTRSAWEDKLFERRELVVELVDQLFQAVDMDFTDCTRARNANFAAEVKEVVLDS